MLLVSLGKGKPFLKNPRYQRKSVSGNEDEVSFAKSVVKSTQTVLTRNFALASVRTGELPIECPPELSHRYV